MKNLLFLIFLIIFAGCAANPRYRTGGHEVQPEVTRLDKSLSTTQNLRLGEIMQSFLGKPYKGTSQYEEGLDCSHFTGQVFRKYNKSILPRTAAEQFKIGSEVHFNKLQYGDLVFFKTDRKRISHVGIYVGNRRFIHVSSSYGVIVTNMNEKYWSERYVGGRRILP